MAQDEQNPNNRDELLVDYLENDLEAPLKKDLELLLEHSPENRRTLRDLKIARTVTTLAAGESGGSDAMFARMHDNIMANLDRKVEDNVVVLPVRRRLVAVAAVLALVVLGGLIMSQMRKQGTVRGFMGDVLISESASDLDAFSDSLINSSSDSDFFMEVAARKIDSLPQDETASFYDQLRE